jgi:hypothetical protein
MPAALEQFQSRQTTVAAMLALTSALSFFLGVLWHRHSMDTPLAAKEIATLAPGSCEREALAKLVALDLVVTNLDLSMVHAQCAIQVQPSFESTRQWGVVHPMVATSTHREEITCKTCS